MLSSFQNISLYFVSRNVNYINTTETLSVSLVQLPGPCALPEMQLLSKHSTAACWASMATECLKEGSRIVFS